MINPILAFSAKRRMRSIRTPILLTAYSLALAALAMLAVYQPFLQKSVTINAMRFSVNGYGYLLIAQFLLLALVAPAMTAGSICGERERQTLDLLLVTQTGTTRIVLGKLLESFGFLALMILCSLPMLSLVVLTGGATFSQVLVSVLFLLAVAFAGLSVGLCCSAFLKRTVTATVTAYLAMLAIGVATFVPLWYDAHQIDMIYRKLSAPPGPLTHFFSIAFSTNPGLGLFALIKTQTGMFDTIMWNFSYTLANTMEYLPFGSYALYNICFMFVASMALCLLAALRLRHAKVKNHLGRVRK